MNKWKQTVIRVLEYARQAANEETERRRYEVQIEKVMKEKALK